MIKIRKLAASATLLVTLVLGSLAQPASAFKANDINVHLGGGWSGTKGLTGILIERFFAPHHAFAIGGGIDIIGISSNIGYRYMWAPYNDEVRNVWYGKCLFLFECDDHLYVGVHAQYVSGTEISVAENGATNKYAVDPRTYGMLVLGDRNRFTTDITLDFEITYRTLVSGGSSRLLTGMPGATSEPWGGSGVGFNLALGYNF